MLSADELLEFMETWSFAISFATASLEIDLWWGVLRSQQRGPPPFHRHWPLVLKYFRY